MPYIHAVYPLRFILCSIFHAVYSMPYILCRMSYKYFPKLFINQCCYLYMLFVDSKTDEEIWGRECMKWYVAQLGMRGYAICHYFEREILVQCETNLFPWSCLTSSFVGLNPYIPLSPGTSVPVSGVQPKATSREQFKIIKITTEIR